MKFLFKIAFLILVSMSNSAFSITGDEFLKEVNEELNDVQNQFEQEEKALSEKINDTRNQVTSKRAEKIAKDLGKMINSGNCNCTKLNLFDDSEREIVRALLVVGGYMTPKSEKGIQEEVEDFIELFPQLASDKEKYAEKVKERNEQMKCMQKILRAINELKKQNKSE